MTSRRAFLVVLGLLFGVSVAVTIRWCASLSAMGIPMPGGWTMSMAWMRMPDQTWPAAGASFEGMWVVMMTAMMLPSLVPILWRSSQTAGQRPALMGAGYLFVWAVFGAAVFPLGVGLTTVEMRHPAAARAVPMIAGVVVLMAGALQFTAWKARELACWREPRQRDGLMATDAAAAWRRGVRLGLHCGSSSVGLTVVLLVAGVMDLRVMAAVGGAITAERLAPNAGHVMHGIGIVVVGAGLIAITRAAGLL